MVIDDRLETIKQSIILLLRKLIKANSTNVHPELAIITFGGMEATTIQPLTDVTRIHPSFLANIQAGGLTSFGDALSKAKDIIEDENQIPADSIQPTVIVVTDGVPADDFTNTLSEFCLHGSIEHAAFAGLSADKICFYL